MTGIPGWGVDPNYSHFHHKNLGKKTCLFSAALRCDSTGVFQLGPPGKKFSDGPNECVSDMDFLRFKMMKPHVFLLSLRIHVWYSYLHFTINNPPNVAKYTINTWVLWVWTTYRSQSSVSVHRAHNWVLSNMHMSCRRQDRQASQAFQKSELCRLKDSKYISPRIHVSHEKKPYDIPFYWLV